MAVAFLEHDSIALPEALRIFTFPTKLEANKAPSEFLSAGRVVCVWRVNRATVTPHVDIPLELVFDRPLLGISDPDQSEFLEVPGISYTIGDFLASTDEFRQTPTALIGTTSESGTTGHDGFRAITDCS